MAATIEVLYFNSFWLKTLNTNAGGTTEEIDPVWPNGYPYNTGDPSPFDFPGNADTTRNGFVLNWFIEESRIRGGYNNTQVDLGVKAYLVEDEPNQQHRFNSLIYSGVYNSRTGVNNTNEFSVGKDIIKSLDPANGSIQKLYAENTNLTVLQESKVSSALIDKDAIYSAEGGGTVTSSNLVIGQVQPYLGEYGISRNPESFAVFGYQKYFADKDRGVVLRLSRDGITEISQYGMVDYFRDNLSTINENNLWAKYITIGNAQSSPFNNKVIRIANDDVTDILIGMEVFVNETPSGYVVDIDTEGPFIGYNAEITISTPVSVVGLDEVSFKTPTPAKILGAYDIHNKNYVISLQNTPQYQSADSDAGDSNTYSTLAFDEMINGWSSFFTYKPSQMFSIRNSFYSMQYSNIWQHYSSQVNAASFYGQDGGANITFIFNQDSGVNKVFQTVNYEGDNGWQVDYFISGATGYDLTTNGWEQFEDKIQDIKSYYEGQYTENGIKYYSGFNRKENKYYANLVNTSVAKPGEVIFGESMSGIKGRFATVKFSRDTTTDPGKSKELWAVGTKINYIR